MMQPPSLHDLWTTSAGYAAAFQSERAIEETLNLLRLSEAQSLLDVGSGNGAFALAAAQAFPHCMVVACDALDTAIEECQHRAANLELENFAAHVVSADSLPYPDASFDRVLSRFLLHHIANPRQVFAQVHRVLQPEGLFLLQTPCNLWEPDFAHVLQEIFLVMDSSHPRHYHTSSQLHSYLRESGLVASTIQTYPFTLPGLDTATADAIKRLGAAARLKLTQRAPDSWSIELAWFRTRCHKA